MILLLFLSFLAALTSAHPGYYHGLGFSLPAAAPYYAHAAPAPVALPAPHIYKAPAPIVAAPIIHAAPLIKAYAAPAATSYASITQYHISHPAPVAIKTFIAPQPAILKGYYSAPAPIAYGHGYHHP